MDLWREKEKTEQKRAKNGLTNTRKQNLDKAIPLDCWTAKKDCWTGSEMDEGAVGLCRKGKDQRTHRYSDYATRKIKKLCWEPFSSVH
jgi:hypothetical protein